MCQRWEYHKRCCAILTNIPIDIVLVSHISKVPDLVLGHEHSHTERVYRGISESLVVEAASSVQPFEVLLVCLASEEAQITDLEITEELAVVVVIAVEGIEQPIQVSVGMDQFRMRVYERHGSRPKGREGPGIVENVHCEAVLDLVVSGKAEDIVVDVAKEMDVRFDAPVEVVFHQSRVSIEETTVPSTHVPIGYHPAFSHANSSKVFETVHEAPFVDPFRKGPVLFWNDFIVAFCSREVLGGALNGSWSAYLRPSRMPF